MALLRRRGRRIDPKTPGRHSNLVASAAKLTRTDLSKLMSRSRADWQRAAWDHYDTVGELRYGVSWISSALSRATLYIAEGDTDVPEPVRVDSGPAVDYLNALFDGPAGQAQMLKAFGIQLSVPGECYVIGYHPEETNEVSWVVASGDEISRTGGQIFLNRGDGNKICIGEEDWILRVWNSHPRLWWQADSPTRALLPVLREMDELTKKVFASIDSRLAGAGILMLPQEMSFPRSSQEDDSSDEFDSILHRAMVTPLQDRDDASALVPIVLRVPGDQIASAKLLTFGHDLDSQVTPMREAAIKRIALGLDMPAEILLGMGSMNHWGAWQLESQAVKIHIEPMLATLADALTTGYLWPLMDGNQNFTIWFSTSELTNRDDRGGDADAVYDRGGLSEAALRKFHGFGEDEAPSPEEHRERVLIDIAKTNAELAPQILQLLDFVRPGQLTIAAPSADAPLTLPALPAAPSEARALPAPPEGKPKPEPVPQQSNLTATALVACDVAVMRALEVAGKRLLDRTHRYRYQNTPAWLLHTRVPVASTDMDRIMQGAWSVVESAAPELVPLVPAMDEYVRTLLEHGVAHERRCLVDVLRRAVITNAN